MADFRRINNEISIDMHVVESSRESDMNFISLQNRIAAIKQNIDELGIILDDLHEIQNDLYEAVSTFQKKKLIKRLEEVVTQFDEKSKCIKLQLPTVKDSRLDEDISTETNEHVKSQLIARRRVENGYHLHLIRAYLDINAKFNAQQADIHLRYHKLIKHNLKVNDPNITDAQVDHIIQQIETYDLMETPVQTYNITMLHLEELKTRLTDILHLEKSIHTLHELFTDLAILIESQGINIDSIEQHVHDSREYVHKAERAIVVAQAHRQKIYSKQICICTILIIILVIIIVVILKVILN
jgi:t-SNARE complex subunit (syntaxin)